MGFTIGKKGEFLENISYGGYEIGLLGRGDGVEVMVQTITADKIFYLYPSDNPSVMEFVYILTGEMVCELNGEKINLGPHDYYSAKDLTDPIHFTAKTDVMFLWIITEPTFFQMSENVTSLKKVVDEVEKKDSYTYRHSERVSIYAMKIAKKLMLSKEKLEDLYLSSFLHDIGKINICENILNKPEKLTFEEYEIIKRHPSDGSKMVEGLYNEQVATIIAQHHERLDGSGYPNQLVAPDILLEAKIIAVSDTFDAMTEDRAYRKGYDAQTALNEIKRLAGIKYDVEVVAAFESILEEEGLI